jgi:Zn-dependent protease
MLQVVDPIFFIAVLLFSVVLHEVSHGHMANILGDPTARLSGRLTLNPLKHLDPIGSIAVPLVMLLAHGPIFGWAKPVPYNPYNLRNQRYGTLLVGVAGVAMNFALAIVFGLAIRFSGLEAGELLASSLFRAMVVIVGINLVLGIFNLVPIPPLDGSKVLFSLLPFRYRHVQYFLEQYWFLLFIFIFFFAWRIVIPVLDILFTLITGQPLGLYAQALPI